MHPLIYPQSTVICWCQPKILAPSSSDAERHINRWGLIPQQTPPTTSRDLQLRPRRHPPSPPRRPVWCPRSQGKEAPPNWNREARCQGHCFSPFHRYESDTGPLGSPILHEESDAGANSSESEYLLSDPTGYRTQVEFSPDKKVQFNDGNDTPDDREKSHKEKKKKK